MMRLTLRTLLAYLDDVLSPADTKIIGQKIQESPMAQLLVSRIREVMRRRRLKAPEVFGPELGIDPNIVAQYLDNTLPADQYADVERVLLASDELLAETAACHQVLTQILGETTELSAPSRERLYALGPVDSASQFSAMSDTSLPIRSRTPESISVRNNVSTPRNPEAAKAQDEKITTVPDYLKPSPWARNLFPSAVVMVLILICAALLAPSLMTGVQQANQEIKRNTNRNKVETKSAVEDQPSEVNESGDVVASGSSEKQRPENVNQLKTDSTGLTSEATELAATENTPSVTDDGLPENEPAVPSATKEVSDSPEPDPVSSPKPATKSSTIPPEVLADLQVPYRSTEGIVIQLDALNRHWMVVPRQAGLQPNDILANLEPFDGVLEFEKANVRATLVGETVMKVLMPSQGMLQGIGIGRGKVILQATSQGESSSSNMGIAIGEDVWKLEFLTADSVCALEVTTREPTQFMKLNDYYWFQATLYVISGSARWSNQAGVSQEIAAYHALNIIPERAATVRSAPVAFTSVPDWCEAAKRRNQPVRRYQQLFERAFAADEPVEQTMITVAKTAKNPKIAELAVRSLSAMDQYAELIEAFAECPHTHEEARSAARDGLRQWLPMNANNGPLLKEELDKHYPPAEAEAIYRMLWGFSREDVKGSQVTSAQFTNWMRNQRLEIRELSYYWVERLTGQKIPNRPSAPERQRETDIKKLENQITRDNGLVKGP